MKYSHRIKNKRQRLPDITVIIPVWNRVDIVEKCLDALENQETETTRFETLVVDDGSEDGTYKLLAEYKEKGNLDLRVIKHSYHQNLSAARNTGLRHAEANIVLFLDADILARPDVVEIHANYHRQYLDNNVAILGNVSFPKEWPQTPFAEINSASKMWRNLKPHEELPWWNFFGGHISAKKNFLISAGGFDEGHSRYEDLLLGRRLMPMGLKIIYANEAVGFHHHWRTPKEMVSNAMAYTEARLQLYRSGDPVLMAFLRDHKIEKKMKASLKRAIAALIANRMVFPLSLWTANVLMDRFSSIGTLLTRMLCYHVGHSTFKREIIRLESNRKKSG